MSVRMPQFQLFHSVDTQFFDASCDVGIWSVDYFGLRVLGFTVDHYFVPPNLFVVQSHMGCRVGRLTGESCLVQIQIVPVHPPFSVA